MKVTFEEVSASLDLEFLFERESIPYKIGRGSSGMQINAKHCPACGDSRWRTYLNADSGLGNCFVCNESYNKLTFAKAYFGLEWRDLMPVFRDLLKEQGWRPKRMVTAAVDPGVVKLPYSHPLPLETGENLQYLEQRGVTADYARYFNLRWCQFGWWDAVKDDGEKWQQKFDQRVIIPVYDLDGALKTFQGRDLTDKSPRKYLFPIGLPGTGRYLFNGQNVQLTKEVIMGEGAFDVIAIKLAFDEEVTMRSIVPIGSFGKHLSYGSLDGNDQVGRFIKLKAGGIERVTIMWDGEEKALVAALDAAKRLTSIGLQTRVAMLPLDKDPNEVLPEVVRKAYWEAQVWSPKMDVMLRMKNPYAIMRKNQ